MSPRQLRFLAPPKPLTERFGREFFLRAPQQPGVYFMYDDAGRLLYVGQSRDLRARLNSYRHVHPDRDSRKTLRLVHRVARIEWQVCDTHDEAMVREVRLLQEHRPQFNRADTFPAPRYYIGVQTRGSELIVSLRQEPGDPVTSFGPFNSWARPVYAALLRLLFVVIEQPAGLEAFPHGLLRGAPARTFGFPAGDQQGGADAVARGVADYFSRRSDEILPAFAAAMRQAGPRSFFERDLLNNDMLLLQNFYEQEPGPRAAARMAAVADSQSGAIPRTHSEA